MRKQHLSLSIRDAEGGIRFGFGFDAHAARHTILWVQPNFIEFKS
jgi:hypothetical protein